MSKILVWRGPLFDPSGYGSCGRAYVKALHQEGVSVHTSIHNFTVPDNIAQEDITSINEDDYQLLRELELNQSILNDVTEIYFVDHNTPDIVQAYNKAVKNITYSVWETDKLPAGSVNRFDSIDEIWTASEFSKAAFVNSGIDEKKVHIIPHICDSHLFTPDGPSLNISNKKEFTFLSNFEFHKRKGYDILIPAFLSAFKDNDNVSLLIKTYNLSMPLKSSYKLRIYVEEIKEQLGIGNDGPSIIVLDRQVRFDVLAKLYRSADAYISTSRGEAWDLPLSEAILSELPAIAPSLGGHMQYFVDNRDESNPQFLGKTINSTLVEIRPGDVEKERDIYEPGMQWVESSQASLIEAMHDVYNNYDEAKERVKFARQSLIERFSPQVVVNIIRERLDI